MKHPFDDPSTYALDIEPVAIPYPGLAKYNFSGGHNDCEALPLELMAKAAQSAVLKTGGKLGLYHMGDGPLGSALLRSLTAQLLNKSRGIRCTEDNLMITTGSGQALDIVCRGLVRPGSIVLTEEFTFVGMLLKLKQFGASARGIKVDQQGMVPEDLRLVLEDLQSKNLRASLLYIQPTLQNPTTSILSAGRRHEIVEIARAHDIILCEDECYVELSPEGVRPTPLVELAPERVIYIGSYSKSLAPALRVGYLMADGAALARLAAIRRDMGTGAIDQLLVAEYFSEHYSSHVTDLRARLAAKRDVMVEALTKHFGDHASFHVPEGGLFIWVRLKAGLPTNLLLPAAEKAGIVFNPGQEWAAEPGKGEDYLRLCYGLPATEEIREGVRLLAEIYFATIAQKASVLES